LDNKSLSASGVSLLLAARHPAVSGAVSLTPPLSLSAAQALASFPAALRPTSGASGLIVAFPAPVTAALLEPYLAAGQRKPAPALERSRRCSGPCFRSPIDTSRQRRGLIAKAVLSSPSRPAADEYPGKSESPGRLWICRVSPRFLHGRGFARCQPSPASHGSKASASSSMLQSVERSVRAGMAPLQRRV